MVGGIGPERVNEHVDVGKDQRPAIRSSSSLDRFRSTPGRVPPDAFEIGKCTRDCLARCVSAKIIFSPSSIREVNVRPFSAALFLALRSRSSESRIVVLMHQSIQSRHIYVKQQTACPVVWRRTIRTCATNATNTSASGARPSAATASTAVVNMQIDAGKPLSRKFRALPLSKQNHPQAVQNLANSSIRMGLICLGPLWVQQLKPK